MCRLLAYLGPPLRLDALMRGHENSMYEQSYRPREMITGTVNVDGFGVGWYMPEIDPTPVRYVTTTPQWADPNFDSLSRKLSASCFLASVRGATDGMPFGAANTAPFASGRYLFAHNGYVQNFRADIMRTLRAALSDERYAAIAGGTDSEHLFALWLEHLHVEGITPRPSLASAAAATVHQVANWVLARGTHAMLNLMATDGQAFVATRYSTTDRAPSLYALARGDSDAREIYIASERLFTDVGWREIPRDSVVTASRSGGIEVASL